MEEMEKDRPMSRTIKINTRLDMDLYRVRKMDWNGLRNKQIHGLRESHYDSKIREFETVESQIIEKNGLSRNVFQ